MPQALQLAKCGLQGACKGLHENALNSCAAQCRHVQTCLSSSLCRLSLTPQAPAREDLNSWTTVEQQSESSRMHNCRSVGTDLTVLAMASIDELLSQRPHCLSRRSMANFDAGHHVQQLAGGFAISSLVRFEAIALG